MSTGTQPTLDQSQEQLVSQTFTRERWLDLGLIVLIAFVPLVFKAGYALVHPIPGTPETTNARFLAGLIHQVGALALLAYILRRRNLSLKDIGLDFHRNDIAKGLSLCSGAFVTYYLVAILIYSSGLFANQQTAARSPQVIFAGASVGLMLAYSLASSIFEETLVRGYLMTELIGLSCPVWLATCASILLQGSYHLYYGISGALAISTAFALWAIYFAISRKLWPVLLAHAFYDLMVVALNSKHY
jgi:membrane protease YdiL (CAAX protease family)